MNVKHLQYLRLVIEQRSFAAAVRNEAALTGASLGWSGAPR